MSLNLNQIKAAFQNKLKTYSLTVPDDWVLQCAEFVVQEFPNQKVSEYSDHIFKQLLDYDLESIGTQSQLSNILNTSTGNFNGKFFLQVNLCLDSTQSHYSRLQKLKGTLNENALVDADLVPTATQFERKDAKKNRMLTLYTTDGQNKIIGIEYQPINNLKEDDLIPGTKIEIHGQIMFVDRILYLRPGNVTILGGNVEELCTIEYLIEAIESEITSKKAEYRQPRDRVENFETSSNVLPKKSSTQSVIKNRNNFDYPLSTDNKYKNEKFSQNQNFNQSTNNKLLSKKETAYNEEDEVELLLMNADNKFLMNFGNNHKIEKVSQNQNFNQSIQNNAIGSNYSLTNNKFLPKKEMTYVEEDEEELLLMNADNKFLMNGGNKYKIEKNSQNQNFNQPKQKGLIFGNYPSSSTNKFLSNKEIIIHDEENDEELLLMNNINKIEKISPNSNFNKSIQNNVCNYSSTSSNKFLPKREMAHIDEDDEELLLINADLHSLEPIAPQNACEKANGLGKREVIQNEEKNNFKVKRVPSDEINVKYTNCTNQPNNSVSISNLNSMKKQKFDSECVIYSENREEELNLAKLTNSAFLNSCCRKNLPTNASVFNLASCVHRIKNVLFRGFINKLQQTKLNWQQDCLINDGSLPSDLNVYLSNELLSEFLELTCQEAKNLSDKARQAANPNETPEYQLFERKRINCENKFGTIRQCEADLRFDLDKNKFCVSKFENIRYL